LQRQCLNSHAKVKLSMCLTKHQAIKTYPVLKAPRYEDVWGSGSIVPRTFSSALDGSDWSTSRLGRFTVGVGAPITHWRGGWADPRAGLEAVAKRKMPCPCRESNTGQDRSVVTILTELSRFYFLTQIPRHMFENRVQSRIFGPKREEVTGGWRKIHNEELHNLYSSLSTIMSNRWGKMRWTEYVRNFRPKTSK